MGKINSRASSSFSVELASTNDLRDIISLLVRNDLPQDGLAEHVAATLVAREGRHIVGSATLELYGSEALLRSVAVEESMRGQGIGQKLIRAALDLARQHKVKTVFLLTETASKYFLRFGFHPATRTEVPAAVQGSVEFTSACPVTALTMRLHLET